MEQPRISIVINSFNQSKYLEQTILSVLEQDYPNFEILLVDGESTDGSQDIIKKYGNRFTWWVSEPDQGQADGINKGLRRASGVIVAWLNSDDYYLPNTLQRVAAAYTENPDASIWYGDVVAVDENGKPFHNIPCARYELTDLMKFKIINQPAVFMNGQALRQSGYLDPTYHYLLDHHLWLRIAAKGPMHYSPVIWAAGRYHANAKNIANAEQFGRDAYRIAEWLITDTAYQKQSLPIHKSIRAGAHRINARYLLDADKPGKALLGYLKGLFADPSIVLPEFHRMLYCLLAILGLKPLKSLYLSMRRFLQPVKTDSNLP